MGTLFTSVKNTLKLQENLSEDFQRIFKEFFKCPKHSNHVLNLHSKYSLCFLTYTTSELPLSIIDYKILC